MPPRHRRRRPRCDRRGSCASLATWTTTTAAAALGLVVGGAHGLELSSQAAAVNWSLVTADAINAAESALAAPIGCTCVDSSASSSKSCAFFDCGCTCDLTAGACDPFCCCDAECTTAHVAAVRAQGLCEDTTPIKPSIEYCSADLTLATLSSSAAAKGVNALLADSVLCVAVDNNEVVGDYLPTTKEETMSVANAFLKNPKLYTFATTTANAGAAATDPLLPPTGSAFALGDVLPVFAASAQSAIAAPWLPWIAPSATSTECLDHSPIRFGYDRPRSTCVRPIEDLAETCTTGGGPLDPAAGVTNLRIPKTPNAQASDTVAVEIELYERDTAITTSTTAESRLATPYPSYFPTPHLRTNVADQSQSCIGALVGVDWTIQHDGNGHIEGVRARVTIGEVTAAASEPVAVAFTTSVTFTSSAVITRSLVMGNLATYPRSGNPGYVLGRPVRIGAVVSGIDAQGKGLKVIDEVAGGLALPGLGDCDGAVDDLEPVLFGEDSRSSCSVTLTADEFSALCSSPPTPVAAALAVKFTRVGAFGNADPFLVDDWLELDYDPPTKSPATLITASPHELRCENLLASLDLEFLVAEVGPANAPQAKIVAARATHGKATWSFWRGPGQSQANASETFVLTTTVSFVRIASTELAAWIPPTPPLWFSIPSDVFYPFVLETSAAVGATATLSWGLATTAAAVTTTVLWR